MRYRLQALIKTGSVTDAEIMERICSISDDEDRNNWCKMLC